VNNLTFKKGSVNFKSKFKIKGDVKMERIAEIFNKKVEEFAKQNTKENIMDFKKKAIKEIIDLNKDYLPQIVVHNELVNAYWLMNHIGHTEDSDFYCAIIEEGLEGIEGIIFKRIESQGDYCKRIAPLDKNLPPKIDLVNEFTDEEIKTILEFLEEKISRKEKNSKIIIPFGFYIWDYKEINSCLGEKPIERKQKSIIQAKDFEESLDKLLDSLPYSLFSCYYGFKYYTKLGGWIEFSAYDIRIFYDFCISDKKPNRTYRSAKQ